MRGGSVFQRNVNPLLTSTPPASPPPRPEEVSARSGIPLSDLVRLSANESPLGPSPLVRAAVEEAGRSGPLHRYPNRQYPEVRRALAEFVEKEPDQILPTDGATEVLPLVLQAFTVTGSVVCYVEPGIPRVGRAAAIRGREPDAIRIESPFEVTPEAVLAQMPDEARLLFISSPNNTTSRLVPPDVIAEICGALPDCVVLVDEHYIEAATDYRKMSATTVVDDVGNLLVSRTFSKMFGLAGMRAGYAVGPAEAIGTLRSLIGPWCVSVPTESAILSALADLDHLERAKEVVASGREYIVRGLAPEEGLVQVPEPQGNFVLYRSVHPPRALMEALWDRGVMINGYLLDGHVRITVGTPEMNQRLVAAMREALAQIGVRAVIDDQREYEV